MTLPEVRDEYLKKVMADCSFEMDSEDRANAQEMLSEAFDAGVAATFIGIWEEIKRFGEIADEKRAKAWEEGDTRRTDFCGGVSSGIMMVVKRMAELDYTDDKPPEPELKIEG